MTVCGPHVIQALHDAPALPGDGPRYRNRHAIPHPLPELH